MKMKVAVVGLGLIGGSFEKASLKAGYSVASLHHADVGGCSDADLILVCLPPSAVVPWLKSHSHLIKDGAIVVDIAGVKRSIMDEFFAAFPDGTGAWRFVGGHPMAGKAVSGYANSSADLFLGASMILVPQHSDEKLPPSLEDFFLSIGFSRVVVSSPERHDEMIAFTSQLCHMISSAYVREDLARFHEGFSAGSFRDMSRVGAVDPDMWAELFLSNRDELGKVLGRYIERLVDFQIALDSCDKDRLKKALAEGVASKAAFGREIE